MYRFKLNSVIGALLLLVSVVGQAAWADDRAPVPSQADVSTALSKVKELYSREYAERSVAARAQFAHTLSHLAQETTGDATMRYVLLSEARRLAIDAGEVELAYRTLEETADEFKVDTRAETMEMANQLSRQVRSPEANAALLREILGTIEESIRRSDYEDALAYQRVVRRHTRAARDRMLEERADEVVQRVLKLNAAYKRLADQRAKLTKSPKDPQANLAMGEFYAYQEGTWWKATRHLAKSKDAFWEDAAKREQASPEDGPGQTALADLYWQRAEQSVDDTAKAALFARARYWYRKALPQTTGVNRRIIIERAVDSEGIEYAGMNLRRGIVAQFYGNHEFKKHASMEVVPRPHLSKRPKKLDRMAARWTGYLRVPQTGYYSFGGRAENVFRIEINHQLVVSAWSRRDTSGWGTIRLVEGFHPIRITFKDDKNHASLSVSWKTPGSDTAAAIPDEAFYYDLMNMPK